MKKRIIFLAVSLLIAGTAMIEFGGPVSHKVARADDPQVACIMTAFFSEIAKYDAVLTGKHDDLYAGRKFLVGNYGDNWQVVAVIGGVGLANAASSTQLMFDHFNCDISLFSGIDGAVDPEIRVGDLVVPEKLAFHDYQATIEVETRTAPIWVGKFDQLSTIALRLTGRSKNWRQLLEANEAVLHGDPRKLKEGMLLINPFDAPSGVQSNHYPVEKEISYFNADGSLSNTVYLPVDEGLLDVAKEVASEHVADLPTWTPPEGEPYQVRVLTGGTVVSGDQFIMSEFYRRYLAENFDNVKGLEMEGAAFMQTCLSNQKRCLVTRTASDLSRTTDWWNPVDYELTKDPAAFKNHVWQKQLEMFAGGVSVPFTADLSAQFNLWMLEEMTD